ncbi:MAG: lantibiotic dehydratase [Bacteroidota bacterium]
MPPYQFAQHLLLRMPVKSPADYSVDPQSFLDDHFFRAAILVASPAFYATLERQFFQTAGLSDKEAHTLQKYINRYCFRPTPFGLFSSVSLTAWSTKPDPVLPKYKAHIRATMMFQNLLGNYLLEHELYHKAMFESNPSIYRVLNEYRFFRTGLDEQATQRDYQLQSIAFSKLLRDLTTACNRGCSRQEITGHVIQYAACTPAEAEDYTDFLIDSQLLVSCLRLSITGEDYLTRLAVKLDDGPVKATLLSTLARQETEGSFIDPSSIQQMELDLTAFLPEQASGTGKLSVILQRTVMEAGPGPEHQDKLRDGIGALALLSPSGQSAAMSQFISSFQRHFEGQTLALLLALDPEAGIGYQLPETEKNNPLLETLNIPYRNQPGQTGAWSAAHSLLMETWLRDKSASPVIRLNDADLERLKTTTVPQQLLGMSVLFRTTGNKVFIESAGGINAPALMGRFTLADEQIADAARLMAHHLETQNPDLLFAELLHLSDPHTDNINRRAPVYQYEIPVTAVSTLPDANQVQLSDLYISIVNNMVILFSKKHQKLVVPRLTSAYNYSLNKLPLFRFLADLPYQYGRSSIGLDLRQFFPNLHFYPRVEYKETILSLATWIITGEQLGELQNNDRQQNADTFRKLSSTVRLPRYFSFVEGDQELVFDGQSQRDIEFFCNCVRQKKEAVIKEFLEQPTVRQYNACLLPAGPLVLPRPPVLRKAKVKVQRKYVPGSEWLYLKIYAPRIGVNRLLLRLRPLLSKRYGEGRITQWFFIRYEDHAPHIRLRLQVSPASISEVLLAFKTKLEDRIQQHVIREFQIDVYTRELERYAAGGIENTERFFWASSELVLHFLKQAKTNPGVTTYAFALYSTHTIIAAFIAGLDEQVSFTLGSFQQFLPEFTDKPIKVELDRKYRELTPGIIAAFREADPGILSGSIKAGSNFLSSLRVIQESLSARIGQTDYLRSIIHMHLNRIFTDEARKQEMIYYYLLYKYLLSVKGRNKGLRT